ncbi:hypothetical protein AB0897_29240, partial [Streptomyces sp. NPDC007168]
HDRHPSGSSMSPSNPGRFKEYLDLNGVMIPLRDLESNAPAAPFLTLAPADLDALDSEGT